jgi:signal transduction histidine kinase
MWEHENIVCVVYDKEGQVHARTTEIAAASVPSFPDAAPGGPQYRTLTVPILGRRRALAVRQRLGSEESDVLLLASLEEVDHELKELLAALTLAVPAALAASAGVAYLLARKALSPVEQLRRSTQEITADRLSRRLPVRNPGDELGRLAQTINEMIGRLERSFAEVRRFTADASHELRTPLPTPWS